MTERLAEIRARVEAANPGPWAVYSDAWLAGPVSTGITADDCDKLVGSTFFCEADTEAVLALRNNAEWLLDELERREALIREAVELFRTFRADYTAFITAFEANEPYSSDGEELAKRIDAWLASPSTQETPT